MSIISASTTTTTALQYTADTDGTLVFKTGATPTTALTIGADQSATFAGTVNFAAAGFTSLSLSGNLIFTGTGNRITGDFSTATLANRVAVQSSTTNGNTGFAILPNGTATSARLQAYGNSDPTNAVQAQLSVETNSEVSLRSSITGTASYAPLTMYTGGSERLRIDTSGNVGIGTSSPASKLALVTANNEGLYTTNGTQQTKLFNGSGIGAGALWVLTNDSLSFGTNNAERMRIDSSGNVGIGTSSPSARLQIYSTGTWSAANWGKGFYVTTSSSLCNPAIGISDATGANNWAIVNLSGALTFNTAPAITDSTTAGVERMRIDTSGNLLVNATTNTGWGGKVFVQQTSTSQYAGLNVLNTTGVNGVALGHTGTVGFLSCSYASTGSFTPLAFDVGGSERMRITSAGNVGIGTSNPATKLEISDGALTAGAGGYVLYGRNNSIYPANGGGYFALTTNNIDQNSGGMSVYCNNAGTLTERMRIDSTGRVLVGVTSGGWGVAGSVISNGYGCRAGQGGALGGNGFNIYWNGNAQLWIDSSNIGNIAFSSDYRIKRNVETQTESGIEKILKLRPVTYQMADYGDGLFKASDEVKEGFIAHEVQEVIPSGAEGEKDEENRIQNLRLDAILSVAVKAIQELNAKVEAQAAEIAALKGTK